MPAPPPVLSIFLVFICRQLSARFCRCIIALLLLCSVADHVYKSGLSAPVVLHIDLHGCKLWVSAPVVVHWCCPELRQEPALLRVLRNSPRSMPLFGFPIIVMFARYTSRKQGKLQRACACGWPKIHVCRYGPFAPVVLHIDLHGCKLWVSAPVVVHWCRPELRQEPAQLRVLRNSPRAMPLFGLLIIVMFARYTSRKQVKLQHACACGGPEIHRG